MELLNIASSKCRQNILITKGTQETQGQSGSTVGGMAAPNAQGRASTKHRWPKCFLKFVVRASYSFHTVSRKHCCIMNVVKTLVAKEGSRATLER